MNQHKIRFLRSRISFAIACSFIATGCAVDPKTGEPSLKETFNSDDPCAHNARNIGIIGGTIAGILIGNQMEKKADKYAAVAVGAIAGGFIGADIDRKKCELSKIAKKYELDMTYAEIKSNARTQEINTTGIKQAKSSDEVSLGLSVTLRDQQESGGHFMSGSDELAPRARGYFNDIAAEYSYIKQAAKLPVNASQDERHAVELLKEKRLLIVGHSDDTGSSRVNADLSERRAKNVAKLFHDAGIAEGQIYFQGAGETLPVADNRTAEGRAKNRRVEIIDLNNDTSFRKYLTARKARTDYYRVTESVESRQVQPSLPAVTGTMPVISPTKADISRPSGQSNIAIGASDTKNTAKIPVPAHVDSVASAKVVKPSLITKPEVQLFDFGGAPAGGKPTNIDIGRLVAERSTFNIISPAQAADAPALRSCSDDRPRVANGVKSLRDSKEISTAEYLPNLYDTSWVDTVNGHLVALTHVAVLQDGGSPARKPELLVYKNYAQNSSRTRKPDYIGVPEINTYQGEKALLYRVFVDGPLRCMDIVIPNFSSVASGSWLYYGAQGQMYMARFNPRIAK